MTPKLPILHLTSLPFLLSAIACGPSEEAFARSVVTSTLQTSQQQQMTDEVIDDRCSAITAEAAAADAAARPAALLYPASCVDKTADGPNLHVAFDRCTGPFGRVELNGGVDARFEVVGSCELRADVSDAGNLTVNHRPLAYQATAGIEVVGGTYDIDWDAHFSTTTRRGKEVEQVSALRVVMDRQTSCRRIDGEAQGHVANFEYDWEVENLSVCPGECPASGVVHAGWEGRRREHAITVEFDGSSTARVTGWSGRAFDVPMVCEDAETDDEG